MDEIKPKLIVGLGNPGDKYRGTRHNAGFLAIDALIRKLKKVNSEEKRQRSLVYKAGFAGSTVHLAKPLTYMNLSGQAVGGLQRELRLSPEEILVIYDCLDLPLGKIRLRMGGGSGGHKGIGSVIEHIGTQDVPRLRIGIGRTEAADTVDYVLDEWSAEEKELAEEVFDAAADSVLLAVKRGVQIAMNEYNRWVPSEINDVDEEASNSQ